MSNLGIRRNPGSSCVEYVDELLDIFLHGEDVLQHDAPPGHRLEGEVDESRSYLQGVHVERDEVEGVEEDLLVVQTDVGGVRLLPHPPLDVPAVSEQ